VAQKLTVGFGDVEFIKDLFRRFHKPAADGGVKG
jgi:hypothetical protein